MNKCIILSVQPQWLHKILTGKKTIEIRKSTPKCDYPIDVYLYCTKPNRFPNTSNGNKTQILTFDESTNKYRLWKSSYGITILNGKIVAKFTLNKVDKVLNNLFTFRIEGKETGYTHSIAEKSCLDFNDMHKYLYDKDGYAWHIDNLQIFDKPMELREFYRNNFDEDEAKPCNCGKHCKYEGYDLQEHCGICTIDYDGSACPFLKIQRQPQSWCYAYKEE